jgi:hypothetical protein
VRGLVPSTPSASPSQTLHKFSVAGDERLSGQDVHNASRDQRFGADSGTQVALGPTLRVRFLPLAWAWLESAAKLQKQQPTKGVFWWFSLSPISFPQSRKIQHSAWLPQVADHLVPNQVLGFFEFFRKRERGSFSVFKGLQKPLSAQIQEN